MNQMSLEAAPQEGTAETQAALVRRVERVEQENARLKEQSRLLMVGGAAVAGMLALLLIGQLASAFFGGVGDVVEARRFVLRDADGMARGVWELTPNGASRLVMQDRDARERIRLTLLPDGSPGLTLADRDGRSHTVLGLLRDQTSTLVFADQAGKTRAVFGVPADGSSTLVFADRDGETRLGVGVDAAGIPGITTFENEASVAPVEP
ncbi:MAG: hypothetical protein H0V06_07625 [Gemmatimonadetes bacterium]|nr:hypothetical protein [Gemmatimonadota bacterium]